MDGERWGRRDECRIREMERERERKRVGENKRQDKPRARKSTRIRVWELSSHSPGGSEEDSRKTWSSGCSPYFCAFSEALEARTRFYIYPRCVYQHHFIFLKKFFLSFFSLSVLGFLCLFILVSLITFYLLLFSEEMWKEEQRKHFMSIFRIILLKKQLILI